MTKEIKTEVISTLIKGTQRGTIKWEYVYTYYGNSHYQYESFKLKEVKEARFLKARKLKLSYGNETIDVKSRDLEPIIAAIDYSKKVSEEEEKRAKDAALEVMLVYWLNNHG